MPTSSEEISKYNANSQGKPDSNLANDALNLDGIPAEDYATKDYVHKYHDNKEKELKEYIDKQDQTNLNNAKSYADNLVTNQDFSDFAKTADVQALDTKLSEKIEDCGKQCAANLKQVVNDINTNFEDVGKSIEKLNQGQNDLFQSVSNGKAKIAGAITDKGVTTSANDSFDTMASNIRNINTSGGGGEVDPNFVNTSDADATSSDILIGKSAYVKGSKVYGIHICNNGLEVDTSDATASSYDIALGKTAYVRGSKIIGTHIDVNLDTSDATATPHDIRSGKTAYVNGQKIEGDLNVSGSQFNYNVDSVEKIYGIEYQSYELEQYSNKIFTESYIGDIIFYDNKPIGSIYIKDSFLIIDIKNREDITYSLKDDLGLESTLNIAVDIKISNFDPISDIGYIVLDIYEKETGNLYIDVFKAKIEKGASYGDFSIVIDGESKLEVLSRKVNYKIHGLNFQKNVFFLPHETHIFGVIRWEQIFGVSDNRYYIDIYEINDKDNGWQGNSKLDLLNSESYHIDSLNIKILNGGKLIWMLLSDSTEFIILDNSYKQLNSIRFSDKRLIPSYNGTFAYDITESVLYTMQIDAMGNVTLEKLKDLPSLLSPNNKYGDTKIKNIRINDDVSVLFLCESICIAPREPGYSARRFSRTKVYSIDFSSDDVFNLIQTYDNFVPEMQVDGGNSFFCTEYEISNETESFANVYECNKLLYPDISKKQVLGLKYQGEFYYKHMKTQLTALPEDVVKGRTFMGRNGSPEIGTLEV